jgi:phosphoglycolate phosphatase-like HAD superfamily hydrolase
MEGAAVGLATGNIRRGAMLKLEAVGLARYFAAGGFGEDAEDRASIGRIARERLEARLGARIETARTVLVGDSVPDVESARANGYRSLAVGTGWCGREALDAAGPDRFEEDLSRTGEVIEFIFSPGAGERGGAAPATRSSTGGGGAN